MARQGDQRSALGNPAGDQPFVCPAQAVVAAAGAHGGHVQRAPEIPAASSRPGLLRNRAAPVLERGDAGELGDTLRRERPDVGARRQGRADEHRTYADDLPEPRGDGAHPLVRPYRGDADGVHPLDLTVDRGDCPCYGGLDICVQIALELACDQRLRLEQVPADAYGALELPIPCGPFPDEVQLVRPERRGVVPDHLAVYRVGLFQHALRLSVLSRLPRVQADRGDSGCDAFGLQGLVVGASGLEADDSAEGAGLLDERRPAAFCVPDVFLVSVGVADVQAVLADVNSHVHSGLIHGILSLSYELKQLSGFNGPAALATIQFVDHSKWRRPNSRSDCRAQEDAG